MQSTTLTSAWAVPRRIFGVSRDLRHRPAAPAETRPLARWHLQRRCSLSPVQLGAACGAAAVASLAVGTAFWLAGAPVVLAFAGIEAFAVVAALVCHAAHGSDGETLALGRTWLHIDRRHGLRRRRERLPLAGLQVEHDAAGGVLRLHAAGRTAVVGARATPAHRRACARALAAALADAPRRTPNSRVELIGR